MTVPIVQRHQFTMSAEQWRAMSSPVSNPFAILAEICKPLRLDPKSVIHVSGMVFSALPVGHGKAWCWPLPLKCLYVPEVVA
jgi:hypothetical protein